MRPLRIATERDSKKGSAFSAHLLASLEAGALWEAGRTDSGSRRPVLAVLGGSEQELRPFVANLRVGRKAAFLDDKTNYGRQRGETLEFLKSAGYHLAFQRSPHGLLCTAFLPALFRDAGLVDPWGASFVVLPPATYLAAHGLSADAVKRAADAGMARDARQERLDPDLRLATTSEEYRALVPLACLAATELDRRVRMPLPPDPAFAVCLLLALAERGLLVPTDAPRMSFATTAQSRLGVSAYGLAECGFARGVVVHASHADLEPLVAAEISAHFGSQRRSARKVA